MFTTKKSNIIIGILLIVTTIFCVITIQQKKSITNLTSLNIGLKKENTKISELLDKETSYSKNLIQENAKLVESNKSRFTIDTNQYIANKNLEHSLISLIFKYFYSLQNEDIDTYNQIVGDNDHLKAIYNKYKDKEYNILKIDAGDKIPQSGGFFVTVDFHNSDTAYIAVIKKNGKWEIYGWD